MSGQSHLTRHSERGKMTWQAEKEVRRQHQGIDRPGVHQVPAVENRKNGWEETGCEVHCGAPTTPTVKGLVKEGIKVKWNPVYDT